VGLDHARGRPLRKFSKGMLQRVGIAQALMGDPELVVLDEPMTGLDPLGRKEIRDLILELKREGRTVFYSTHILPDVEMTCDRVAMVLGGRTRAVGPLGELLSARLLSTEVVLRASGVMPPLPAGAESRATGEGVLVELPAGADVDAFLAAALGAKAGVVSVTPRRESLEEYFVRNAEAARAEAGAARAGDA
jgi:ABC-2 type transport system ATP-binding protein